MSCYYIHFHRTPQLFGELASLQESEDQSEIICVINVRSVEHEWLAAAVVGALFYSFHSNLLWFE